MDRLDKHQKIHNQFHEIKIALDLYPLNTLKQLGITEIMIVSGGEHIGGIAEFLGDGSEYDVNLTYRVQKDAGGIAQALGLAQNFVGKDGGRQADS